MSLTVTTRPSKTITESGFVSKWNAAHLPIIYKLTSNLFPVNSSVSDDCFNSVTNNNGFAQLELCINYETYQALEHIKISSSSVSAYNGIWQIIDFVDGNSIVINAPYSATATGSIERYYNNYHVLVKVFAGLPITHPLYSRNPIEEISTLKIIPNEDNIVSANIQKLILEKLNFQNYYAYEGTIENDCNSFCGFYIEYAESYDTVSDGEIVTTTTAYTSDSANIHWAINGSMPFQNTYGGNMGEYVFNYNNGEIAGSFLTDAEELEYSNGKHFDISAVIPKSVFDDSENGNVTYVVARYSENDNLEGSEELTITNRHDGVYRLKDTINNLYEETIKYLKVRLRALPVIGNRFTDGNNGSFESAVSGWNMTEGSTVDLFRQTGGHAGTYKAEAVALSVDEVTNGDFSSATGWTTGTGWSIGSGEATHIGGAGTLSSSMSLLTEGLVVRLSYDVTAFTAGTHTITIDSNPVSITGTGTFTHDITISGSTGSIAITSNAGLTIDNVSVKFFQAPSESLICSGDTAITVDANRDYVISAWVYFPGPITETSGNFAYLKPTTYTLAQCHTVLGAIGVIQAGFPITRRFTVVNGGITSSVVLGFVGQWVKIQTIFNTGSNTSLRVGLYYNGDLSTYGDSQIYIDELEFKGPVQYLSDEMTINVDHECSNQEIYLTWLNTKGGWEYYNFTGKRDYSLDIDNSIQYRKDVLKDWDTDFISGTTEDDFSSKEAYENEVVRSKYLSLTTLNWLKTILYSVDVYVVQDTKLRKILIEPGSYKRYTDGDRNYSMEFTFRYTDKIRNQSK